MAPWFRRMRAHRHFVPADALGYGLPRVCAAPNNGAGDAAFVRFSATRKLDTRFNSLPLQTSAHLDVPPHIAANAQTWNAAWPLTVARIAPLQQSRGRTTKEHPNEIVEARRGERPLCAIRKWLHVLQRHEHESHWNDRRRPSDDVNVNEHDGQPTRHRFAVYVDDAPHELVRSRHDDNEQVSRHVTRRHDAR